MLDRVLDLDRRLGHLGLLNLVQLLVALQHLLLPHLLHLLLLHLLLLYCLLLHV